jgi:hypothetical protein
MAARPPEPELAFAHPEATPMRTLRLLAALAVIGGLSARADGPPLSDETLGAPPPDGAIVLLGKDFTGWVGNDGQPAKWPFADGILAVGKGNIHTEKTFGDGLLHVEFNVPYMPDAKGQARGNSGVYVQGRYEVQVLDSYGLKSQDNDCGGIYKQYAPSVNACKPPLQWQTYDITFRQAKRDGDTITQKARITVKQNGVTIIDDKEIDPTPGGLDTEAGKPGPLLLQDHGNDVQFRNIWFQPAEGRERRSFNGR